MVSIVEVENFGSCLDTLALVLEVMLGSAKFSVIVYSSWSTCASSGFPFDLCHIFRYI